MNSSTYKNTPSEISYLIQQLKAGQVFLLLGAGASSTSQNRNGSSIKQGWDLAKLIAEQAGFSYNDEPLADVLQACIGQRFSPEQFHEILRKEYTQCIPSLELKQLFSFPWHRTYTLNVDDTIERLGAFNSKQHPIFFNALRDKVVPVESTADLQIIHLNGEAIKTEHGVIFSKEDYAQRLTTENPWYSALSGDCYKRTPLIVGSAMNEPLLDVEIERLKRAGGRPGAAFLIDPKELSDLRIAGLRQANIHHIKMSLKELVAYLASHVGEIVDPKTITNIAHLKVDARAATSLSQEDITTAMSLRPILLAETNARLAQLSPEKIATQAKRFLLGGPPSWHLVKSDIPVKLYDGRGLHPLLKKTQLETGKLLVVTGAAGAGKTTLTMQVLLTALEENSSTVLYELNGEVGSYARVFTLLQRLHPTEKIILFLPDLFLYGERLKDDLTNVEGGNLLVVANARSGEWRDRYQRHLGALATEFHLERFTEPDYAPLIERLAKYVPSPTFAKASDAERLKRIRGSRKQLLIALREATESKQFDLIIEDEYKKLPDAATRHVFALVGVATLARVGLDEGFAAANYSSKNFERKFQDARDALSDIVLINTQGRLQVRHELYVNHVFQSLEPLETYLNALTDILESFSFYEVPVVSNVSKNDAQLFKFVLNYKNLFLRCRSKGQQSAGLKVYARFEKAFERDGHFWLQYGLYARSLGEMTDALDYLKKSVAAYDINPYAIHALADLKLELAANLETPDNTALKYIDEAVTDLLRLDARQYSESDLYPIATLATRHIHALINRRQKSEAKKYARRYFERIKELQRTHDQPILTQVQQQLMLYVATDNWSFKEFDWFNVE